MAYPTDLSNLQNPASTDPLNNPSHSTQHINENNAIEAIEAKIGVDNSLVATSIDYLLKSASSSNPGHKHTLANGASDVTASAAELNQLDGKTLSGSGAGILTGVAGEDYGEAVWSDGDLVGLETLVGTGNGTTDDTTTLNAFLTANAGKTVKIPVGDYKVTGTINIPASTTVYAYGARIFNNTTDLTLVTMNSGSRVFGLELEGTGNATMKVDGVGISIIGADASNDIANVVIKDCYVHDMGMYGIYAEFVDTMFIFNTRLFDLGNAGFMGLSVSNVDVSHCHVKDASPGDAGDAYGIAFTREASTSDSTTYPFSDRCSVSYCLVEDVPNHEGIETHAGTNMTFTNNTVKNCACAIKILGTTGDAGVSFGHPDNCIVSNNRVFGNTADCGISIAGNIDAGLIKGVVITDNYIQDGGIDNNVYSGGIEIHGTVGAIISNNNIYHPYTAGINLNFDNIGFTCTGNTVIDVHDSSVINPAAILAGEGNNKGIIEGNTLSRVSAAVDTYVSINGIKIDAPNTQNIKIGKNYSTCLTKVLGVVENGWDRVEDTWTYSSGTVVAIPAGGDELYRVGGKVKFTQHGSVKYFYVTINYDTGLSLIGQTPSIVIENTATYPITQIYYSDRDPVDFPDWFSYTPTYSAGGSMTFSSVTTDLARFKIIGNSVLLNLRFHGTTGGSASTYIQATIPVTLAQAADGGCFIIDAANNAGFCQIYGTNSIGFFKYDSGNWGIGADRYCRTVISYEI